MTVRVDMTPFLKFRDKIVSNAGFVKIALKQWAAIYRGFVQERFDKFSKGGGNWKPLAPSTIAGRRKGGGVGLVATILRDTNTLYAALDPGTLKPGAIEQHTNFGVTVGYGGGDRHPEGQVSIADIAGWHDQGTNRIPQRQIIVPPDDKTIRLMSNAMERAMHLTANG